MKAYWWSAGIAPRIPWPQHYIYVSGQLHAQGRDPGIHWTGGWVGPRAGVDMVVKIKIPSPWWDSNTRSSSPEEKLIHSQANCNLTRHY
jgi:hypothetical protein